MLKYVQALLPTFAHMGIEVKVNKVTTGALRNPKLRAAMRGRGIDKLPALLTANNVYLGRREIEDLYDRNLKEFKAFAQRGESIVEGMAGEDELESYYKSEMSQEALDEDDEEEGIGRSDVLMRKYNEAVAKRDRHRPQREKPVSRNLTALAPKEQRRARAGDAPPRAPSLAPRPAQHASERRGGDDDVPEREEPSGDESEIQDLIKRMSQDVGTDVAAKAFAGGGGDSLDGDEEGSDAQDKLMLAKYWGNMESSI